ncbi:MAG: DegT/DnrJ/EryC1/StrS family aminotransferase [Cyclobacteriaceae bacterium]
MKVPFVDLKAQYDSIKEEIDQAISDILHNTSFIGGDAVRNFEVAFSQFIGAEHCVSCANGTDSLEIILKAMEIGPGDEVLVPANSWISSAEAVNTVGAEPVFVDVLESEYTIDPTLIQKSITPKTKAIMPVHLYGLPARMDAIMEIAEANGLRVIEDAAQAHGAMIAGKRVGTIGEASSFSFYPGKNLGAYGDAGGMLTNDPGLAEKLRRIGNHGQITKHDHQMLGRNSRLDTLQAAVLKVKLPYLQKWIEERNRVAARYRALINNKGAMTDVPDGYYHAYHLFILRTKNRSDLQKAFDEAGIGHGIHYPTPLPFIHAYAYKGHTGEDFPVSNMLSNEIISLPIFPEMSDAQIERVAEIVNAIAQ